MEPIDFQKEANAIPLVDSCGDLCTDDLWRWGLSIAVRVECETIERCQAYVQKTWKPVDELPLLYSPALSDTAKGTSHD